MNDFTHIHTPSGRLCRVKKIYGDIAVVYVEPYPIQWWGKTDYYNTIIVKVNELQVIQ